MINREKKALQIICVKRNLECLCWNASKQFKVDFHHGTSQFSSDIIRTRMTFENILSTQGPYQQAVRQGSLKWFYENLVWDHTFLIELYILMARDIFEMITCFAFKHLHSHTFRCSWSSYVSLGWFYTVCASSMFAFRMPRIINKPTALCGESVWAAWHGGTLPAPLPVLVARVVTTGSVRGVSLTLTIGFPFQCHRVP